MNLLLVIDNFRKIIKANFCKCVIFLRLIKSLSAKLQEQIEVKNSSLSLIINTSEGIFISSRFSTFLLRSKILVLGNCLFYLLKELHHEAKKIIQRIKESNRSLN